MNVPFPKKAVLSAVAFFGTLGILTVGYSAFVTSFPSTTAATDPLSSTEWNKMVSALQTLDTKLSVLTIFGSRVGIGTTTPSGSFELGNGAVRNSSISPGLWMNETDGTKSAYLVLDGNSLQFQRRASGYGAFESAPFFVKMDAPDASLVVDAAGRVGMGTSTPAAPLHITSATGYGVILLGGNSSLGTLISNETNGDFDIWSGPFGSGPLRMSVKQNGSVGIGTSSPGAKLDVTGGIRISGGPTDFTFLGQSDTWLRLQDHTGTSFRDLAVGNFYSAGAVRFSSDARLKEAVRTIEDPVSAITKMRGVSWNWKDESHGEGRHMGVIAQEIENVYPNLVATGPDGNKTVAYSELTGVFIEAFKAQQAEIESLKEEVSRLKK